jgi:hypothetical protein
MSSVLWRAGRGTVLSAEIGKLRLQVEALEHGAGDARYMVFRDGAPNEPGSLICSGNAESVRAAMEKAEHIAISWAGYAPTPAPHAAD